MITKHDIHEIMRSVRENTAKLEACKGPHDFVCATPEKPFGAKYTCSICGGTVDGVKVYWYQRGLAHGKAVAS